MKDGQTQFINQAQEELAKKHNIVNLHALPNLEKVVINVGFGREKNNQPLVEAILVRLRDITGQKATFTKAKKSIASFKLRSGEKIGAKLTLRGKRMVDFIYKLIKITLPAIRDFKGLPLTAFDGQGNYTVGIKDIAVFPEVKFDQSLTTTSLEISLVIKGQTEPKKDFIKLLGFPFVKEI